MAKDDDAFIEVEFDVSESQVRALADKVEKGVDDGLKEAFKRLAHHQKEAKIDKAFKEMYGMTKEGKKEAAAASRDKMLGNVKSGIGVATSIAQGSPTGVLSSMGPYGAAAAGAVNAMQALTDTIIGFVQVANPAVVEQLNHAIADVSGVIGQFLTPVVEAAVPWVRMFGDFLASILPNAEELRNALAPLDGALASLKEAIDPLIPLFQDYLLNSIEQFAVAIELLALLIEKMPGMDLLKAAGGGSTSNWKSGQGAAYRGPASYQGIAEAGRGLHLAGFGQAGSSEMRTAKATEKSATTLEKILHLMPGGNLVALAVGNN